MEEETFDIEAEDDAAALVIADTLLRAIFPDMEVEAECHTGSV